MEVASLRALGELHYWERPVDPLWYERNTEPVVSPLAEQSAAQLVDAPPLSVPHLPYIPHPWPVRPDTNVLRKVNGQGGKGVNPFPASEVSTFFITSLSSQNLCKAHFS